jgi:hypothetical protein
MKLETLANMWTKRVAREWGNFAEDLTTHAEEPPLVLIRRLAGPTPTAAALTAPDKLANVAGALAPIIDRAAAAQDVDEISIAVLELLDLANAVECVGGTLAPPTHAAFRTWLPRITIRRDDENEMWYWSVGFAALAFDDSATARRFAGVDIHASFGFKPGETFGFNLQGLLRHLAGALEVGADLEAIRPAWNECLDNFETQWTAHRVDGATLLWIARVVYARVGGAQVATVAKQIHNEVSST